ncbi:ribonuclease 2 [Daucus carota subsp. sativus]|uniref:ribonuclease 2 n=1 Tax=Daucus carota subsp. sativus TaxID=79200 RepID=UPI0007F03F02|nr:PREDICTED: ribonuclease 2 isoform X1 [Daucus carota subsp. sativus]
MASLFTTSILSASLLIVLIGSFFIEPINAGGFNIVKEQREFDYFKLSLQWPGTVCRNTRHCCASNGCCRGSNSPTEFTIHGLWPDYNDGTWPACCTKSGFDVKEISTLKDALEKYWPSYSCSKASTCSGKKGLFWAHEWEKHGTCSSPVVKDEYSYFITTLNVYFKFNVTEVLYEAGYVPSNSEKYPMGGIISAIQNAFHATPEITCSQGAVEELRLCFYKDFKPRDCAIGLGSSHHNGLSSSKSSCPKYVSLPERVSLALKTGEGAGLRLTQSKAY